MPASLIDLYDRLANAPDERTRARVIAEAFEVLESRYPHLPDLATRQNLSETELRLVKEIEQTRAELKLDVEQVRAELKEIELKLVKEIEQVRAELKETELKLAREIAQLRADTARDIERVRASVLQWSFVFWLTQFAAIVTLLWRLWPLGGP
jgi:multidrug resistance efflux pump